MGGEIIEQPMTEGIQGRVKRADSPFSGQISADTRIASAMMAADMAMRLGTTLEAPTSFASGIR